MRIFSQKLHELVHTRRRTILASCLVVLCILIIAGAYYGASWYTQKNILHVGVITDTRVCSKDEEFSTVEIFSRTQKMITSLKEREAMFFVSLGNNVPYTDNDCIESAQADLVWVKTILAPLDLPQYFVLGTKDIENTVTSAQQWSDFVERERLYYAFDKKDVRVIVLDTVLGGDNMALSCSKDPACKEIEHRFDILETTLKDESTLQSYMERNNTTQEAIQLERNTLEQKLKILTNNIKNTRSKSRRSRGRIGDPQLVWLRNELTQTTKEKVLVFSHHPFFSFIHDEETQTIKDHDVILEMFRQSTKEITVISARADGSQEFHEDRFHFYTIDRFDKGHWALFTWGKNTQQLEKMMDPDAAQ